MNISISIKKIIYAFLIFTICLTVANSLVLFSMLYLGHDTLLGVVRQFYFYYEANIPTWFSSILLFTASLLLCIVALIKKKSSNKDVLYWSGLSVIFALLSIDEVAQLHEMTGGIIDRILNFYGMGSFRSPWIIAGGMAVTVFGLIYVKFLLNLPAKIRNLFIVSGIAYVGGALGFEVIKVIFLSFNPNGFNTLAFALFVTVEELLEMLGIIAFIYSILLYIASSIESLIFKFDS